RGLHRRLRALVGAGLARRLRPARPRFGLRLGRKAERHPSRGPAAQPGALRCGRDGGETPRAAAIADSVFSASERRVWPLAGAGGRNCRSATMCRAETMVHTDSTKVVSPTKPAASLCAPERSK